MTLTTSSFLTSLQHHALQIWFLAISVSLLLTTYDVLCSHSPRRELYTSLLIDSCDILIPGSAVGWLPASSVTVGVASSISSVIVGRQIWRRVQRENAEKVRRERERKGRKVRFGEGTKGVEEKEEVKEEGGEKKVNGNGVVNGSVKALVNATGDGNGSVKKRAKKA